MIVDSWQSKRREVADMAQNGAASRVMRWLGRQVGFVKVAVSANVADKKTVYRKTAVEEKRVGGMVLRRTTIDEVERR